MNQELQSPVLHLNEHLAASTYPLPPIYPSNVFAASKSIVQTGDGDKVPDFRTQLLAAECEGRMLLSIRPRLEEAVSQKIKGFEKGGIGVSVSLGAHPKVDSPTQYDD